MILSRPAILSSIRRGQLKLTPYNQDAIGACSIDLTLGNEFKVFTKTRQTLIAGETALNLAGFHRKVTLGRDERIVLNPGELVLGVTKERIRLAQNLCGRLEGRSRYARLGLLVHLSSSLVQPGVDNVQVLEIMNLSPYKIALTPGLRICQLVLEELKGRSTYAGSFKTQVHV